MASTNCDTGSCCVVKVLNGNGGKDALLNHYSRVVLENSESFHVKEELTDYDTESQFCLNGYGLRTTSFVSRKLSSPLEDLCCSCDDASNAAKACLKGSPILRNNTKFQLNQDEQLFMCDWSAVRKLKVCLDFVANVSCSGTAFPYLYVWNAHSSFLWHIEETSVPSSTEQHHTTKFWFLVPVKYVHFFCHFVSNVLNLHVGNTTSRSFINCDSSEIVRKDIEIFMIAQDPRELRVLCHSGCNKGPAIAEAVCYASEVRCLGGVLATKGLQHGEVGVEVASLMDACLPNRNRTVPNIDMVASESTSVSGFLQCEQCPSAPELDIAEMDLNALHPSVKVETNISIGASTMNCNVKVERGRERGAVWQRLLLVQCPQCDKSYKGTRDRLHRVLIHATRCHKGNEVNVVRQILERFKRMTLGNICSVRLYFRNREGWQQLTIDK